VRIVDIQRAAPSPDTAVAPDTGNATSTTTYFQTKIVNGRTDSSSLESFSDSDPSDLSSSDGNSEGETSGDYTILNPEEQARILCRKRRLR
jgi:hypothetical protein